MLKIRSYQLQGTLTSAFWKIPYSYILPAGSICALNLYQDFGKHNETKIDEGT